MAVHGITSFSAWITLLVAVALVLPASQSPQNANGDDARQPKPAHSASGPDNHGTGRRHGAAEVTGKATATEDTPVVFILDCSGSMAAPLSRPAPNVKPPRRPGGNLPRRIDQAREAMRRILDRLVDRPYRVGVIVYGHRAGWGGPNRNAIVRRGPPGLRLNPNEDVETILKVGRFSRSEMDDVLTRLNKLEPLGETPLYLAILEAIGELPEPREEGQKRHIVVITDGLNDQWPDPNGPADKRKSALDVRDRLKSPAAKGIQLDVVGFDLTPTHAEDKAALGQLKGLANLTGGRFYDASDHTAIVTALEESLTLRRLKGSPE